MKYFLPSLLILISFSCSLQHSPEKVAKTFFEKIEEGKYKEAQLYATDKTGSMIKMMGLADESEDKVRTARFEVQECITNKNKAVCTVVISENDESKELEVGLVYENDQWLVDMGKEQLSQKEESIEAMQEMMQGVDGSR